LQQQEPSLCIADEKLLPIPAAFQEVTGKRPSPSTCHRWRSKGSRGIILETILFGSRRMTSCEAVRRFIQKSNTNTLQSQSQPKSAPNKVEHTLEELHRELLDGRKQKNDDHSIRGGL
jgi:Protein of unknown function (DUF1580)